MQTLLRKSFGALDIRQTLLIHFEHPVTKIRRRRVADSARVVVLSSFRKKASENTSFQATTSRSILHIHSFREECQSAMSSRWMQIRRKSSEEAFSCQNKHLFVRCACGIDERTATSTGRNSRSCLMTLQCSFATVLELKNVADIASPVVRSSSQTLHHGIHRWQQHRRYLCIVTHKQLRTYSLVSWRHWFASRSQLCCQYKSRRADFEKRKVLEEIICHRQLIIKISTLLPESVEHASALTSVCILHIHLQTFVHDRFRLRSCINDSIVGFVLCFWYDV